MCHRGTEAQSEAIRRTNARMTGRLRRLRVEPCGFVDDAGCRCEVREDQPYVNIRLSAVPTPDAVQIRVVQRLNDSLGNWLAIRDRLRRGEVWLKEDFSPGEAASTSETLSAAGLPHELLPSNLWRRIIPRRSRPGAVS